MAKVGLRVDDLSTLIRLTQMHMVSALATRPDLTPERYPENDIAIFNCMSYQRHELIEWISTLLAFQVVEADVRY